MEDNQTLINRIKNSGLNDWQKKRLIELLPLMNNKQKEEMLILINQSNKVIALEANYKEKILNLNKEYWQKVKDKKRELIHYTKEQYQKKEEKISEKELDNIETQLNTI